MVFYMHFEIRTTCRPEPNEDLFFKFNPIVLQAIKNNIQIRIFNNPNELPRTLQKEKNINLVNLNSQDRPTFGLLSEDINTNFVMICNSDVFMSKDSIQKVKDLSNIGLKAISGRRYDIYDNFYYPDEPDEMLLVDTGYKQSSRTLDYFILEKTTLEEAGAEVELK